MNYFRDSSKPRSRMVYLGSILLLVSGIMATFAANISINGSNRIEFGQGVYVVEACNGWIQITLRYGPFNEPDGSLITGFEIDGLDTRSCISTNIQFRAYEPSENPEGGLLPLFESFAPDDSEEESPITHNLFTLSIDEQENAILVDEDGTPISLDDPYISLTSIPFSEDSKASTYIVEFQRPLSYVSQLSRITVESGPNV